MIPLNRIFQFIIVINCICIVTGCKTIDKYPYLKTLSIGTSILDSVNNLETTCKSEVVFSPSQLIQRGVCWSINPEPKIESNNYTIDFNSTKIVESKVKNLLLGKTYYIRSYIINNEGTFFGNTLTFNTIGKITNLKCNSVVNIGSVIAKYPAYATSFKLTYEGGDGGGYNNQTVSSTGITGLTATLAAGVFAKGIGTLTYTIIGNTSEIGTASFEINIGGQTCTINVNVSDLHIGVLGFGGVVAYLFQPGDSGYVSGQSHGLIMTTEYLGSANWGCQGKLIGTSLKIGSGASNTSAILKACFAVDIAARICDDLVLNGYSDWYLPSWEELEVISYNNKLIGQPNGIYLSSYERDLNNAVGVDFYKGVGINLPKSSSTGVCAVRAF